MRPAVDAGRVVAGGVVAGGVFEGGVVEAVTVAAAAEVRSAESRAQQQYLVAVGGGRCGLPPAPGGWCGAFRGVLRRTCPPRHGPPEVRRPRIAGCQSAVCGCRVAATAQG